MALRLFSQERSKTNEWGEGQQCVQRREVTKRESTNGFICAIVSNWKNKSECDRREIFSDERTIWEQASECANDEGKEGWDGIPEGTIVGKYR